MIRITYRSQRTTEGKATGRGAALGLVRLLLSVSICAAASGVARGQCCRLTVHEAPPPCGPCDACCWAKDPVSGSPPNGSLPSHTGGPVYLLFGAAVERGPGLELPGPTFSLVQEITYDSSTARTGDTVLDRQWVSRMGDMRLYECGLEGGDVELRKSGETYTDKWPDSTLKLEKFTDTKPFFYGDGERDYFRLTNTVTGDMYIFYDFDDEHTPGYKQGRVRSRTTREWRAVGRQGAIYTYDNDGRIDQITSAEGQDYFIEFYYEDERIAESTTRIEFKTGSSGTTIAEIAYTYYVKGTYPENLGTDRDLIQVRTSWLDTAGNWIHRYTQFRYDVSSDPNARYSLRLKAVFEPDAIQRIIDADPNDDITTPEDILHKGDESSIGNTSYTIRQMASRWFEYYRLNVKTDNSGNGTADDPKCLTVWTGENGEDLETKYGGTNADESFFVKSETVGGCASCDSGTTGIKREYFYMRINHGEFPGVNDVTRLVVEDTVDSSGQPASRRVYGLNNFGRKLREVLITDPLGQTPQGAKYWCQSWTMVAGTQAGQYLVAEYRTPAAHSVTTDALVKKFLDPTTGTNDADTLNAGAGLIHVYEYNSDGFRTGEKVKEGSGATAQYVSQTGYYGGSNDNRKHLVTSRTVYPQTGSPVSTSFTHSFYPTIDTVRRTLVSLPSIGTTSTVRVTTFGVVGDNNASQ